MSEAVHTLEGWFVHHDFRTIDWASWKLMSPEDRQAALDEVLSLTAAWRETEEQKQGSSGMFTILGHKADLLFLHFRPTLEELIELEATLNKTKFADVTLPSYSYVSVVELSNYVASDNVDPETDAYIQRRLKPVIPDNKNICFYPMNKRREAGQNWYTLSMEERREMMKSHGLIGRKYAGQVTQVISGSIGLDDWEWGVTLYADDPVTFKKLIYEMRFDEVSAKYSEFGTFLVGNKLSEEALRAYLDVK
ncbi:chlorite dismutase [Caldalkalibacillus uzonensis]|uniref:Coproheme decarboxylase n=1 Tax=Caldalkalibacillus uzonensis TaxID=353224 RepID=A0ABU0CQI0_9BACI|nr:hydrogen peroxide-dependent heme synthase [Caldalkalibacillus uzonensis]MDQ0338412.1 chlorite dismutase [Caldalkalibacillus uzonensis]